MNDNTLSLFRECADNVIEDVKSLDFGSYGQVKGMGADGTPIKGIDEEAERIALDFFMDNCDHNILSEEAGSIKRGGEHTIIMDPVDGTSNAINGIPFYCISLALAKEDMLSVSVGLVKSLTDYNEYYAVKGKGAYKNDVRLAPTLGEKWNFSVYMGKKAHEDCRRVAFMSDRTRSMGSAALEISMVAEGILDLYYMKTPDKQRSLRITDIAASSLILKEAGGRILGSDFEELNMDLDPKQREDVIALYDDRILEAIR
ncbi:MAG: inositol monophosphatase family protein [Thermoplasmata archaeon]